MTSTQPTAPARSRGELVALALILALSFALRMVFVHEPFERDEGTYAYIGQEILHGGIPYRDAIEIKPPGIMYIYAAMISLVGPSVEGIRVLTAVYTLATVAAVYAVARYAFGVRAGLIGALLFAVYSGTPRLQGSSSNTEVFLNLPILAGVLAYLHWYAGRRRVHLLLAGVALGVAMLIKTTALPMCVALGATVPFIAWRSGLRRVAADVAAIALPPIVLYGVLIAYLATNDALQPFVYWTITFLRKYSDVTTEEFVERFAIGFGSNTKEHLLLWLAAVPAAGWLFVAERSFVARLLAVLIPVQIAAVSLPKHFIPHYFIQLVPFLAIVAGIGIAVLWERRPRLRPIVLTGAALAFGFSAWRDRAFYFEYSPDETCRAKYRGAGELFVDARAVGAYIRERTVPADRIFQWGWEPEIYFYADRRAANPYGAALLPGWAEDPKAAIETVKQSILTKRPVYVVFERGSMIHVGSRDVFNLVEFYYRPETTIGRFALYRLGRT